MTMATVLYGACTGVYLLSSAWAVGGRRPDRLRAVLALSCLVTGTWAACVMWGIATPGGRLSNALELAQAGAWFGFVMTLYRYAVPNGSRLGRLLSGIGAATVLAVGVAIAITPGDVAVRLDTVSSMEVAARLALAVCMILLIENLYRNAPDDLRWHVVLPCIALGGLFIYDIVLFSDALLFRRLSPALLDGRAVMTLLVAPLLAVSARRNRRRWGGGIQVSHRAVFHSASLVVTGVFLVGLASAGEILRRFSGDGTGNWAAVVEVSLVCGGVLAAAVFLTSGSARSGLRHLVINNFLSRRYDYRVEWLRCIETLSQADEYVGLHTRAIKAVADTVDSPGGMIFLQGPEDGSFRWAGSWNLPAATTLIPPDHPLVPLFRDGHWTVEAPAGAPWLEGMTGLWLAVPLSHAGGLMGFALVSRPRAPFALDTEVYGLLRIVAQEVASYIAEQRAAESMLQARQLQEYGQRFAFVAHDIKNVASQLSLLLANAERHISNPEFQRDMLGTVGASVQKITALLARLKAPAEEPAPVVLAVRDRLEAVIRANSPGRRSRIDLRDELPHGGDATVAMASGAFEAAVTHLLDNAFDASVPGARVLIACGRSGSAVVIDIVDQGCGMTPEFISGQLFRPFQSSKEDGFGIGAYQVRELARQAGGDLTVTSAPGRGTTMRLSLPLVAGQATDPAAKPAALKAAR